jgi:phosphoesterase RecJ-like protein
LIEEWDSARHSKLLKRAGLFLLDTAEKAMTGKMEEELCRSKEVFIIDHHQPGPHADFDGLNDPSAASTCELTVALANKMGVAINPHAAFAAYTGIAYDTGFFAYPNTGPRTFHAAMLLQKLGVKPIKVYQHLHENASVGVLLLQQRSLAGMTLHCHNQVAVQMLRLEDFAKTGTLQEDTEGFVNFPLKANEIVISLLLKESRDGRIRCSLRSKGSINVAKVAQELNGGGHINAAGFKSKIDINKTRSIALKKIAELLDKS